jgi:hypothetical protein
MLLPWVLLPPTLPKCLLLPLLQVTFSEGTKEQGAAPRLLSLLGLLLLLLPLLLLLLLLLGPVLPSPLPAPPLLLLVLLLLLVVVVVVIIASRPSLVFEPVLLAASCGCLASSSASPRSCSERQAMPQGALSLVSAVLTADDLLLQVSRFSCCSCCFSGLVGAVLPARLTVLLAVGLSLVLVV